MNISKSWILRAGLLGVATATLALGACNRQQSGAPQAPSWYDEDEGSVQQGSVYGGGSAAIAGVDGEFGGSSSTTTKEDGETRTVVVPSDYGPEYVVTALALPTGDRATSALLIEQIMPREIRRNMPYDYQIRATNLTNRTLNEVTVIGETMTNMEIISSTPPMSRGDWELGDLGAGQSKVIEIRARSAGSDDAGACITANYNSTICATAPVVDPALELVKEATASATVCDDIVLRYTVRNSGTGIAERVRIMDELPRGLKTASGATTVNIPVGDLAEGQSKTFEVVTKADGTGTYSSMANAETDNGVTAASSQTRTVVSQAVLGIVAECEGTRFTGANVDFEYTIRNTGDAAATNTVVRAPIPAGGTFVSATNGGAVVGNAVVWNIGSLAADASRTVSMKIRATQIGDLRGSATVSADCAESKTDGCSTPITGIPAVLLEVVDAEDPIEVGGTVTYVITATNQGSANDTNVTIECSWPTQLEFVSADGATRGTANGRNLSFAPLGILAPGQSATWRVTLRATATGDIRFATTMDTDELTGNVRETEATRLYE